MTNKEQLKPCPFCGCKDVYRYLNVFYVTVTCQQCGCSIKNNTATVHYHKDRCPKELEGVQTYEAKCLIIKKENGEELHWPEHGYVGVSLPLAFEAYGITKRWNRRSDNGQA